MALSEAKLRQSPRLISPALARSSVGRRRPSHRDLRPERRIMATATLSKEMLEAHPWQAQIDRDVLARCIDECLACEMSCTACADASVAEENVASLRRCIRLCLDCADTCDATARVIARQTEYVGAISKAQVSSCRELCPSLRRGVRAPCRTPRALPDLCRGVQEMHGGLFGGTGRRRVAPWLVEGDTRFLLPSAARTPDLLAPTA